MDNENPRHVRGRILEILYEHFLEDAMQMLTPEDLLSDGTIHRNSLGPNAHYLYERGFIELLIGYNPPLFSVARISPDGVDLVEDRERFRSQFGGAEPRRDANLDKAATLMMSMAEEAARAPVESLHRDWLFGDITRLRDELRQPQTSWRYDLIVETIQWIRGYFNGTCEEHLNSLPELEELIGLGGTEKGEDPPGEA